MRAFFVNAVAVLQDYQLLTLLIQQKTTLESNLYASQTKLLEDNAAFQSKVEAAEREAEEAKAKLLEAEKANQKQAEKLEELRRRVRDQHQKGQTVYLLRNPSDRETKKWKVGKTRDLSNRECKYTTAMPDGPEIVHCRHTTDSGLVEKVVLHILKRFRYESVIPNTLLITSKVRLTL